MRLPAFRRLVGSVLGIAILCILCNIGPGAGQIDASGGEQVDEKAVPATVQQRNDTTLLDGTGTTGNDTDNNATAPTTTEASVLPEKGSQDEEHKSSMAIFFILFVIVLSILLVHILIVTNFHYIPESLCIVLLGMVIGLVLSYTKRDWSQEEALKPNAFFLVLLPPIIFEGGYNLHKGNFFANFGSIVCFAVVGTGLSAFVVGGGIYILGQADLIYELSAVNSFAFGSMISAVDPVATLAIFQALKVDPLLYMLVFGESMLNDAVAIVLATTIMELADPSMAELTGWGALVLSCKRFMLMFFGSAALGVVAGLMSALLLKHIDLRKTPSLEFGIMLVFAYLPYGLAEGVHLSGIMAILFCGVTMSHYTHFNLSPMTQITMQQTFRTLAFVAENCTFAYLGMAFFTFPLSFDPVFILWAIVLILIGRAVNIFPLSLLCNKFREHKISRKNQFVMWFSGLRGAVAFALSLHMEFEVQKTREIILATTLSIVIFTVLILGGSTMPLMKVLNDIAPDEPANPRKRRRRKTRKRHGNRTKDKRSMSPGSRERRLMLSKTQEMNPVLDGSAEYSYSEFTETDDQSRCSATDVTAINGKERRASGLAKLDVRFLRPLFVRKFTAREKKESTMKLTDMALEWYKTAQLDTDSDDDLQDNTLFSPHHGELALPASATTATTTTTANRQSFDKVHANKTLALNGRTPAVAPQSESVIPLDDISSDNNDHFDTRPLL